MQADESGEQNQPGRGRRLPADRHAARHRQISAHDDESRAPRARLHRHRARAAFLYSFAALVIARLVEYSPYSLTVQLAAVLVPLAFFALTIVGYATHGFKNDTENMFSERNFTTTWFMYALIAGEIGGMSVILWGFVQTQLMKG